MSKKGQIYCLKFAKTSLILPKLAKISKKLNFQNKCSITVLQSFVPKNFYSTFWRLHCMPKIYMLYEDNNKYLLIIYSLFANFFVGLTMKRTNMSQILTFLKLRWMTACWMSGRHLWCLSRMIFTRFEIFLNTRFLYHMIEDCTESEITIFLVIRNLVSWSNIHSYQTKKHTILPTKIWDLIQTYYHQHWTA